MPVEAWEGMQRHGQDIADRFSSLAQGFSCLLHSHMSSSGVPGLSLPQGSECNHGEQGILIWPWPWLNNQQKKSAADGIQFANSTGRQARAPVAIKSAKENGATAILELGQRLGQARADFRARLGRIVQHVARHLPPPFWQECGNVPCAPAVKQPRSDIAAGHMEWREADEAASAESTSRLPVGRLWKSYGPKRQSYEPQEDQNEFDDIPDEDVFSFQHKPPARFHKHQVRIEQ